MPSTATITSFYNFSANTKARASQVNNNFDVFRGHIIPVEPLTATSADNTYDLGDFSHRWRYGYFGQTRFGATSTAYGSVQLASDTTAAELIFNLNGSEKARINNDGIKKTSLINKLTSSSSFSFALNGLLSGSVTTTVSGLDTSLPVRIELVSNTDSTSSIYGLMTMGITFTTTSQVGIYVKRDSKIIHGLLFEVSSGNERIVPITALNCIDTSATSSANYYISCTGVGSYITNIPVSKMIVSQ